MFKTYPIDSYLRVSVDDMIQYLSPEFKAHLRTVFNIYGAELKGVELEFGSNKTIIIHYKGEV